MVSARERDLTERARSAFGSRSRNRRVTPLFDYTLAAKVKTRDKRRHTRLFSPAVRKRSGLSCHLLDVRARLNENRIRAPRLLFQLLEGKVVEPGVAECRTGVNCAVFAVNADDYRACRRGRREVKREILPRTRAFWQWL